MTQFPTPGAPVQAPTTSAELRAVMMQREELQVQLRALGERQQQLMIQKQDALSTNNRVAADELQARLNEITSRVARIEREKLAADDAIAQALARGVGTERDETSVAAPGAPADLAGDLLRTGLLAQQVDDARTALRVEYTRIGIVSGLSLILLGVLAWRWAWGRAAARLRRELAAATPPVAGQRELKDAVDAIALEVERISENQRFVTRLLSERPLPASERADRPDD